MINNAGFLKKHCPCSSLDKTGFMLVNIKMNEFMKHSLYVYHNNSHLKHKIRVPSLYNRI